MPSPQRWSVNAAAFEGIFRARGYHAAVDAGRPATRSRGELLRVALTAIAATALVVALYYVLPVQPVNGSPLLRTCTPAFVDGKKALPHKRLDKA